VRHSAEDITPEGGASATVVSVILPATLGEDAKADTVFRLIWLYRHYAVTAASFSMAVGCCTSGAKVQITLSLAAAQFCHRFPRRNSGESTLHRA